MSDKNFNDFYDDEYDKHEKQRAQEENKAAFDDEKRRSMYEGIPEYSGQSKFVARKSKAKIAVFSVIIAVLMVAVFFLGYATYMFTHPDLAFIDKVLGLINENAYIWEESDDKYQHDLVYQAANGMLASIDRYSRLLTPEEYYELMEQESINDGVTNGVAYIVADDGNYVVAEVEIGSPAYEKGLFPGDVVTGLTIKNNTQGVEDGTYQVSAATTLDTFKKYIHSYNMTFSVLREGKPVVIEDVEAGRYDVATIEYYFGANDHNMSQPYLSRTNAATLPSDVGYIRLTGFMSVDTIDEMKEVMDKFKAAGKKKLIFDLCSNSGGRSDVADAVASYLCYDKANPKERLVTCVDKDKDDKIVSISSTVSVYDDYFDVDSSKPQIAVLTNGRSASASEMLLGAMLDYGTAVQVGETTYGKGIAQGVFPLKAANILVNGKTVQSYWAAYMTYNKFFTPKSDECHHGYGFTPSEENLASTYADKMSRAAQLLK